MKYPHEKKQPNYTGKKVFIINRLFPGNMYLTTLLKAFNIALAFSHILLMSSSSVNLLSSYYLIMNLLSTYYHLKFYRPYNYIQVQQQLILAVFHLHQLSFSFIWLSENQLNIKFPDLSSEITTVLYHHQLKMLCRLHSQQCLYH